MLKTSSVPMLSAYEKSDSARTYLVTNENDDILGYFSLALSVVDIPPGISKAMMKKMRGFWKVLCGFCSLLSSWATCS